MAARYGRYRLCAGPRVSLGNRDRLLTAVARSPSRTQRYLKDLLRVLGAFRLAGFQHGISKSDLFRTKIDDVNLSSYQDKVWTINTPGSDLGSCLLSRHFNHHLMNYLMLPLSNAKTKATSSVQICLVAELDYD